VQSPNPARLVLLDTYYPGWSATIDGTKLPIQAANVAFRSVAIPAGSHTVDFDYTPTSIRRPHPQHPRLDRDRHPRRLGPRPTPPI
jgi:hypothetical protein